MDENTILFVFPAFLALAAAVFAGAAWREVRKERDLTRFASRTELLKAQKELAELVGLATDLTEQFKRLRSRVGMREYRERERDVPDPNRDPEGYRRYLETKHADKLASFRKPKKETVQ